jgi:hypothetical protein
MASTLRVREFTAPALFEEVRRAAEIRNADEPDQLRYLASYLRKGDTRARSMVIEAPYVDRHYLEEFAGYYATKLHPPRSHATRIHFFGVELDSRKLDGRLKDAVAAYDAACKALSDVYLGFVVVRPIPSAPIGRTLLRPYTDRKSRCFTSAIRTPHDVHLAGLTLKVNAVPFQQQDQAVGACATTAIWSSLARAMRGDGNRATTPLAVTAAASKYAVTGRVLPATAGLEVGQMLAAIREFGYSPHVLKPAEGDHALFLLALKCYLRSGIVVVLRVQAKDEEGHAVACVGFRESDDDETVANVTLRLPNQLSLSGTGLSRVYVHDDRLGAYARAKLTLPAKRQPSIRIDPLEPGYDHLTGPAMIQHAIVPLYPKIRLTAEDLIGFAGEFLPLARRLAGPSLRDTVTIDVSFRLSGRYLGDLYGRGLPPERVVRIAKGAVFSRYVGVVEFRTSEGWLLDVIFDTTDIRRSAGETEPVVGVVPRAASDVASLRASFSRRTTVA